MHFFGSFFAIDVRARRFSEPTSRPRAHTQCKDTVSRTYYLVQYVTDCGVETTVQIVGKLTSKHPVMICTVRGPPAWHLPATQFLMPDAAMQQVLMLRREMCVSLSAAPKIRDTISEIASQKIPGRQPSDGGT